MIKNVMQNMFRICSESVQNLCGKCAASVRPVCGDCAASGDLHYFDAFMESIQVVYIGHNDTPESGAGI